MKGTRKYTQKTLQATPAPVGTAPVTDVSANKASTGTANATATQADKTPLKVLQLVRLWPAHKMKA